MKRIRRRWSLFAAGIAIPAFAFLGLWLQGSTTGLDAMKHIVRARFPNVAQISVPELNRWISQSNAANLPQLLDIRQPDKFPCTYW